jgi:hypothetical protein
MTRTIYLLSRGPIMKCSRKYLWIWRRKVVCDSSLISEPGRLEDNIPAKQDYNSITFCGNEPEHESVLAAAVVTLGGCLPEGTLGMQNDLLVLGSNKVVDDMGGGCIPSRVAKPLGADETFNH